MNTASRMIVAVAAVIGFSVFGCGDDPDAEQQQNDGEQCVVEADTTVHWQLEETGGDCPADFVENFEIDGEYETDDETFCRHIWMGVSADLPTTWTNDNGEECDVSASSSGPTAPSLEEYETNVETTVECDGTVECEHDFAIHYEQQ